MQQLMRGAAHMQQPHEAHHKAHHKAHCKVSLRRLIAKAHRKGSSQGSSTFIVMLQAWAAALMCIWSLTTTPFRNISSHHRLKHAPPCCVWSLAITLPYHVVSPPIPPASGT